MKLKRGGIDTILAYIVVAIPLFYVLVFMVATLYHFSVQMYINQAVKETLIMASSYGTFTSGEGVNGQTMEQFLKGRLKTIDSSENAWDITYGLRKLNSNGTIDDGYKSTTKVAGEFSTSCKSGGTLKGSIMGIKVTSVSPSLLGAISQFGFFSGGSEKSLHYSAFREEIIRNDLPQS